MCSLKDNCKYVLGSKGGRPSVLFPFSIRVVRFLFLLEEQKIWWGIEKKPTAQPWVARTPPYRQRYQAQRRVPFCPSVLPSLWKSLSHVWLFVTPWKSPWNSPGQNTGVGSLSLLQGIFPAQVSHIASGFFTSWATTRGTELQAFGQCFWCWAGAVTPARS